MSAAVAIGGKPIAERYAITEPVDVLIGKPSADIGKPKGANGCIVWPKIAVATGKTGPF